jgi:hypothetical protein
VPRDLVREQAQVSGNCKRHDLGLLVRQFDFEDAEHGWAGQTTTCATGNNVR